MQNGCGVVYNHFMKNDIHEELLKYARQWVAVTSDYSKVVTNGKSITEVEKKLKSTKYDLDSLVIMYVNDPNKFTSPNAYPEI